MKISTARLKQIIREELFYREFHRKTDTLTEVESEKQRRYMCAMKDSDDRPEGLSKAEAEEMCTGPMKEGGAKPLSGTRVKRKSDGMTGYRTVGKKKDRAWSIKWNDGTYERNVPRSEFESIGDKD